MNKKKLCKYATALIIICMFINASFFSCSYKKTDITANCQLPDSVSFNNHIMPLFNSSCNGSGCHSGQSPAGHLDLTASLAYAQLSHPGRGYIDTINPKFSILYNSMISNSSPMPPAGHLSDCSIQLVLKWIQQKAKNN